jgi:glutamate 5-kinase
VPIINENDVVSTAEIRFGDNDRLAARVAQMVGADALVLLSTVDGLYTADPARDPGARHIPHVARLDDTHAAMAADAVPGLSTGGMRSKLEAARIATGAGIAMLIADGRADGALGALMAGNARATVFAAQDNPRSARQKWIQAHMRPRGTLAVDAGAAAALARGGSLLPVGVHAVEGDFKRGDAVAIAGPDGARLGVGLAAYDAAEARAIAGRRSADIPAILGYAGPDALVHRNDMAVDA